MNRLPRLACLAAAALAVFLPAISSPAYLVNHSSKGEERSWDLADSAPNIPYARDSRKNAAFEKISRPWSLLGPIKVRNFWQSRGKSVKGK